MRILKFLRIFIMDFYEFFINFRRVFFKFSLENVANLTLLSQIYFVSVLSFVLQRAVLKEF